MNPSLFYRETSRYYKKYQKRWLWVVSSQVCLLQGGRAMSEAQGDNFSMREPEPAEQKNRESGAKQSGTLPEINFSSFILSLGSSALYHFGEIPDPVSGAKQRNLDLARQTIDILVVLRDKTTGNLSDDEEQLLESLLHDLQMRYVQEREK
jgi:hypothetical protein